LPKYVIKAVERYYQSVPWTTLIESQYLSLFGMAAMDKCPKCGKMAWKPDLVIRFGKDPEKAYKYYRYRHPLDGRTKRNKTCYVREPQNV